MAQTIVHPIARTVALGLTNAFAIATMVPMTANQNSHCVPLRGGRGDQPAVRTCPAMYPPPSAIAAAQPLAFLPQRAKMDRSVAANAAAKAADGSICFSNCKSIGSRKRPLLLNAF